MSIDGLQARPSYMDVNNVDKVSLYCLTWSGLPLYALAIMQIPYS